MTADIRRARHDNGEPALRRFGAWLAHGQREALLLFSADEADSPFVLPGPAESRWSLVLDTAAEAPSPAPAHHSGSCVVAGRSLAVLTRESLRHGGAAAGSRLA